MANLKVFIVSLAVMLLMSGVLSEKARKGKYGEGPEDNEDGEVWLFHSGNSNNRENYMDPISGMKKGFQVDVLNCVCEIAGKDCRLVEDVFQNCWDNVDGTAVGGAGIFNFYYDACIGWTPSYTRARTYKFSESFTSNKGSNFIGLPGNLNGFDGMDLTGRTIGLVQGLLSDEACILRASDTITGGDLAEFINFDSPASLEAGIRSGEVDAGFSSISYPDDIEVVSDPVYCGLGGDAMMMRKDNRLTEWYDPAFNELIASGKYREICDNLLEEHGDLPGVDPKDICLYI